MPEGTSRDYVAVIDIGSNAVRFVVYDGLNRAPFKIHNERTQCHLGKHLATTGRLNPDGVASAFDSIGRYAGLIRAMKIREVRAVATAAMRDAEDGPAFIKKVKDEFGLSIRIIEGEEEARLSALGVMMNGLSDGVIGDYGGGSLELIAIRDGAVRHKASLPLGAHRLHAIDGMEARIKAIDAQLQKAAFLKDFTGADFYAIGGAWRSMARAHMHMAKHPVLVLDRYAVPGGKATEFAGLISKQSVASLEKMVGLMEKRLHDMGVAALAMSRVFEVLQPARLVFSGTGLREGMLYDLLPKKVQEQDALIAACEKVAAQVSRFDGLEGFAALNDWMAPLFAGADARRRRLLEASCLLTDIGWFEHEDYQARHAFERILVMPFYGADHADRLFLALSQYARYAGEDMDGIRQTAGLLLDAGAMQAAVSAGLAQRMGYLLTGGALTLLKESALALDGEALKLRLNKKAHLLNAEVIGKALAKLAAATGRKPVIDVA
jgi:exopolyphosphatase / guanosine-5'-triphosphate,3'-diphosphate pyrophosphatase